VVSYFVPIRRKAYQCVRKTRAVTAYDKKSGFDSMLAQNVGYSGGKGLVWAVIKCQRNPFETRFSFPENRSKNGRAPLKDSQGQDASTRQQDDKKAKQEALPGHGRRKAGKKGCSQEGKKKGYERYGGTNPENHRSYKISL
jgi:hypothetical protein